MTINCIFSEPIEENGSAFEYSKMDCEILGFPTSTIAILETTEKIENEENLFYLDKRISYGDFLIIAFLIILLLGAAVGGIREFAKNRKLERL